MVPLVEVPCLRQLRVMLVLLEIMVLVMVQMVGRKQVLPGLEVEYKKAEMAVTVVQVALKGIMPDRLVVPVVMEEAVLREMQHLVVVAVEVAMGPEVQEVMLQQVLQNVRQQLELMEQMDLIVVRQHIQLFLLLHRKQVAVLLALVAAVELEVEVAADKDVFWLIMVVVMEEAQVELGELGVLGVLGGIVVEALFAYILLMELQLHLQTHTCRQVVRAVEVRVKQVKQEEPEATAV